jgi:hypothetical protein
MWCIMHHYFDNDTLQWSWLGLTILGEWWDITGTSADLFAVMVLLNFYIHILIHHYFTALFDIFYHYFFIGHFSLLTLTWVLSWVFERWRPTLDHWNDPARGSWGAEAQSDPTGGSWGARGWRGLIARGRGGWWSAIGHLQVSWILIHF